MSGEDDYSATAFFYIHQNPVAAGFIDVAENWTYSSFKDFTGLRPGTLCNKERAFELLNLFSIDFNVEVLKKIDEERVKKIFS